MAEANGRSQDIKFSNHIRPFTYRSRYRFTAPTLGTVSERGISGSQSSIATLTGSTQNLLEPTKLISMQEDAKSRKISTEVIKRSLYKSVTAPCRRRMMNRYSTSYYDDPTSAGQGSGGNYYSRSRMFQSLPVTPAESAAVSPSHSPTSSKSFFYGFLSRGTTPRCTSPEPTLDERDEEGEESEGTEVSDGRGLDSIFRPHPRYISANNSNAITTHQKDLGLGLVDDIQTDELSGRFSLGAAPASKLARFRNNSSAHKQNDVNTTNQANPV